MLSAGDFRFVCLFATATRADDGLMNLKIAVPCLSTSTATTVSWALLWRWQLTGVSYFMARLLLSKAHKSLGGLVWIGWGECKNGEGARAVIRRVKVNNSPNNTFVLITNFSRSPTASPHSLFLPLTMNNYYFITSFLLPKNPYLTV